LDKVSTFDEKEMFVVGRESTAPEVLKRLMDAPRKFFVEIAEERMLLAYADRVMVFVPLLAVATKSPARFEYTLLSIHPFPLDYRNYP
jgi:hypothetical protein